MARQATQPRPSKGTTPGARALRRRLPLADIPAFLERIAPALHIEQLFSCLPDTNYFAKDLEGRFVQMDQGFVDMLGCARREEVLGKTDYDFFPKDLAEKYTRDDRQVMKTGEPLRNLIEPVPDGLLAFNWWVVNKVPLRDREGKVIGLAGMTSKLSSQTAPTHYGEGLFKILSFISENYSHRLSMPDLATRAGLSVRSLERNFLKTFNTTPLRYINRVRLQAVRRVLVNSNKSLATISEECGFYDQSHMTAQFTRHFGMSPRKYRSCHRLATT
jgi:AraC-like DNA-binding protein